MKKRKKPIFLVAVLALLVVTVAAMNASALGGKKSDVATDNSDANVARSDSAKPATTSSPADTTPAQPLVAAPQDGSDDPPMNVKPIPAVADDAPKIAAPKVLKDKVKSPDRAGTLQNSGWYMSGRN